MLPRELAPRLALSPADVFFDSDPWTREIFALGEAVQGRLEAEVARAVVDLDRDPSLRPPQHADGVVKTVTLYGKKVWTEDGFPSPDEIQRLVDRYHRPYHEVLERSANRGGVRLGIDCHAMAPRGAPNASDAGCARPLFCLGNLGNEYGEGEGTTCPPSWVQALARSLEEEFADIQPPQGQPRVAINHPFRGSYVLQRHGRGYTPWIHFTVNRCLYLKETEDHSEVPDSNRDVIADLRLRILRTFVHFSEALEQLAQARG
jgi:formiminoglutamase